MVEVRVSGRAGRGGFEEVEVEVGVAPDGKLPVPGADERTEVEVAPAPALSHGFGGDGVAIT